MITVYDSSNYAQTVLFNKAYQHLKLANKLTQQELDAGQFVNLDGYFAHMKDLVELSPSYAMIPSDEKPFEINANTRTVLVPADFAKCAGVVGDNMCEIITFTVDRYFDYVDLATTTICVQWKTPTSTGISHIGLRDLTTVSGKMRFGWPLTNKLTETAGNIVFAVKFFKTEADKTVYVLNTTPATIPIKDSLNLNSNDVIVENTDDLFIQAVSNSMNPSYSIPATPSFNVLNLPDYAKIDKATDTLVLKAQASAADAGHIDYQWYFTEDGTNSAIALPVSSTSDLMGVFDVTDSYEKAGTAKELRPNYSNIKYYKYDSAQGTGAYIPVILDENNSGNIDDSEELYVRYATLTINPTQGSTDSKYKRVIGKYQVGAKNSSTPTTSTVTVTHKVIIDGDEREVEMTYDVEGVNTTHETMSRICNIPAPQEISMITDLNDNVILEAGQESTTLHFEVSADNNNPTRAITWYSWNEDSEDEPSFDNVNGWNKDGSFGGLSSTINSAVVTPGWYYAHVNSVLNRATTSVDSKVCRVVKLPQTPSVTMYTVNGGVDTEYTPLNGEQLNILEGELGATFTLKVEPQNLNSKLVSDDITYEWYYGNESINGYWRVLTPKDCGPNSLVASEADTLKTKSITVRIAQDLTGSAEYHQFYCVVKNHLAGMTAEFNDNTKCFTLQ